MTFSREDCISELQSLNPISRDGFRKDSEIPEKAWVNHFGNWQEFKRQAGILPSRHENQLSDQIARFASKDKIRSLNEEKSSFEDNYIRPYSKRFQSILVGSDLHDINCDNFYRRLFIETALRVQPEKIVLNGDIFDFPEFSKYTTDPREFKVVDRIKWVHEFLEDLRDASPESEIDLIEGNHEARLLRHLAEASPAVVAILSDLHQIKIKDLLALDKYEVNFYARADLAVFSDRDMKDELSKNYLIINDQLLCHHFSEGKNFGYPGISGHNHKHIVWNAFSPQFGSYEWHQSGCGHKRQANYTNGERWSNGFLLAHLDTHNKRTQFEYIDTTYDHCVIGGKFYTRTAAELETFN